MRERVFRSFHYRHYQYMWLAEKKKLNCDKSILLTFRNSISAPILSLCLNEHTVTPKPLSKYLGVFVDSNLSFCKHHQRVNN